MDIKLQELDREIPDRDSAAYELGLIESLNLLLNSEQEYSSDIVPICIVASPYLSHNFSKSNLMAVWAKYTDKEFKRVKFENYIMRYLVILVIYFLLGYKSWSWFSNLSQDIRTSIAIAFTTVILYTTVVMVDFISELYDYKIWKKGVVANFILLIGAIIALIAYVFGAI